MNPSSSIPPPTVTARRRAAAAWVLATLLVLATGPVQAQAQSQGRMNVKAVAVTSTAPVAQVESVQFSGQAVVNSRLAPDPDFGRPSLVMLIDLSGVTGVGAQSGTKYLISTQEHIVRPHAASQNVEFTFAMATGDDAPIARVRTGSARFVMNVDVGSGLVSSVAAVLTAR